MLSLLASATWVRGNRRRERSEMIAVRRSLQSEYSANGVLLRGKEKTWIVFLPAVVKRDAATWTLILSHAFNELIKRRGFTCIPLNFLVIHKCHIKFFIYIFKTLKFLINQNTTLYLSCYPLYLSCSSAIPLLETQSITWFLKN